jgi:hypothetical protein
LRRRNRNMFLHGGNVTTPSLEILTSLTQRL